MLLGKMNYLNRLTGDKRYQKTLIVTFILLISLLFSQITIVWGTEATQPAPEWSDNWNDESCTEISGFGRAVFKAAYDVYSGDALLGEDVVGSLDIDFLSGTYAPVWGGISAVYTLISTLGMLLIVLYWLLDIIEKVQMESFTLEHFVRASIKLLLGVILMSNGLPIFQGILSACNGIFSQIDAGTGANEGATATVLNQVWQDCTYQKSHPIAGAFALVGWMLELLVPAFMMLIIKIVVYVVVYSRIVELFVRTAFAPIGMANIYSGGMSASGYKYIKKIAAVALAGCVILVVLNAYTQLSGLVNFTSSGTGPIKQLVLGFTVVTLVIKAQGWSNDIIGV